MRTGIGDTIAKIISFIFQPLLMPFYGVALLLSANSWLTFAIFPQLTRAVYVVVFLSTFMLPALSFLLFLQRHQIQSLEMKSKRERDMPYLSTLIFYAAGWYVLYKLPLPRIFSTIILGSALAILLAFVINLKWKISIHMIALGGLAGILYSISYLYGFDFTKPITILFFIAGLTAAARIRLQAHVPAQVYAGFVLGFFTECCFLLLNR